MAEIQTKINPESWYNLNDIFRFKMFPWAKSFSSVRKFVDQDRLGTNLLKVNIIGDGKGKKYHFKGENIIKFIKSFEN